MNSEQKLQIESVLKQIPGFDPFLLRGDAWLDHGAAMKAINFFADELKHIEGSARGEPFILRPWQAAIVGNIFGWKRKDEAGRTVRRFRKSLIFVPRGNGKTPLAAGIVLYAFYCDGEPGAQCYLAAGQAEQAGILFRNARGMVEQNESLLSRVTIYGGDQRRQLILNSDRESFCKVIPADAAGQHGGIPHITVVDELHVQENRDLLDVFETAMSKKTRSQPLLVLITTADYDRVSICNEIYKYACAVRDNGGNEDRPGYDPSFLPVIYEAERDDDWHSEDVWWKANPNLGVSVSIEGLRLAAKKADENPAFENTFCRLHLNQRTSQEMRLIRPEAWDDCYDDSLRLENLRGRTAYLGLDLASREDLTSLSMVIPDGDDLIVFVWSWCPEDKVRDRARKNVPYDAWAKAGWIIPTPGASTDYAAVREKIVELDSQFRISHLYADGHEARETATILMESHGFQDRYVEIPQTMTNLSVPTKELVFRVKHKSIRHNGNPVMRWAIGNLAGYFKGVLPDGVPLHEALDKVPVMPSKSASADKIDPVAATVNAIAAKLAHPEAVASDYELKFV